MSKIKGKHPPPITCPSLLHEIVTNFFPQNVNTVNLPIVQVDPIEIRMVSGKEVLAAATNLAENGLDGISFRQQ